MWIERRNDREWGQLVREAMRGFPEEYGSPDVARTLPEELRRDSVVSAHSLIPGALAGIFSGYRAMLDPELPLTRVQQEMIAVVVSALNDCYH